MSEEKNTESSSLNENKKGMTIPKINNPLQDSFRGIEMYQKQMENIQAQLKQIKNPDALKAITNAQKNFEKTREILTSMLPNTPPLADRFKIQEYVAKVFAAPQVNNAAIAAYQKMGEALQNAALSGSITDYKTNLQNAIEAEEEFSDSSSIEEKENPLCYNLNILQEKSDNIKDEDEKSFQELKEETGYSAAYVAFDKMQQDVSDINSTLLAFFNKFEESAKNLLSASQLTQQNIEKLVDKAKENNDKIAEQVRTAEKNGKTVKQLFDASQTNFEDSKLNATKSTRLSWIAIGIAVAGIITQVVFSCRAEKNDKTGELIEVVKKSHPWSEQQISADDAKNVSVAFHAITEALQKNVQLEKDNIQLKQEIDRLQTNLKKAQDNLSGLEKKYNVDINSDEPNKLQCLRKKLCDIEALITVILDKTPKNLNATKNTGEK